MNSAKHAGVERIDIYVEVQPDAIEAFVRDAGTGSSSAPFPMIARGFATRSSSACNASADRRSSSRRRAGTEVELHLPCRSDTSSAGSSDAHPMRPAMSFQPTVVLVDDHDLVRAGVRAQLGDAVYVVGEAGDVAEAVDVICDRPPMSYCSTSTSRRGRGATSSERSPVATSKRHSWRSRCPTHPTT
ncbi:MAG: hypothetical protein R2710_12030 [Acidimicrobiales bacterium]